MSIISWATGAGSVARAAKAREMQKQAKPSVKISGIMSTSPVDIPHKVKGGELTVGVVGVGWMGLPFACLFAKAGAHVIGIDTNSTTVNAINSGKTPISERGLPELLGACVRSGRLVATTDVMKAASESDVIVITVPTMIDKDNKPDYSYVEAASTEVGRGMRSGSLVIFQSTCGPGVTERVVKKAIEKSSRLEAGRDFGLAYSPIRAMAGQTLVDLRKYARAVGGINKQSTDVAAAVLSCIVDGELIKVRDIPTAEASKLFETVYRDVCIALSNEFAIFCEEAGIDYFEAARAANSQPYSHLLLPGVGVGGHCLPVYPYLLNSESKRRLRIPLDAREINDHMPHHVLRLIEDGLKSRGKKLGKSRIAVLGIAYRPNVKEARYAPALELIRLIAQSGARVYAYDPMYAAGELARMGIEATDSIRSTLRDSDCAVLTVGHDEFKRVKAAEMVADMAENPVVVDCTGLLDQEEMKKAGFTYRGVGKGKNC